MKLRQIKNRDELPSNFSLEKYAPSESMDICGWAINLEWRCLTKLSERYSGHDSDDQRFRADHILGSPILSWQDFESVGASPGMNKILYLRSVRDFESQDFYWHGREVSEGSRLDAYMKGFTEFFDDYHSSLDAKRAVDPELVARIESPYYKMLEDSGISVGGDVIVKVDLHGSDEKIMADFAAWLRETRQRMDIVAPKKKFTNSDFQQWVNYHVLPYLDLTMWARANGCEITQQLLGTTLFPNEYGVNLAERIRKVVAPLARGVVYEVFTDALHGQALEEVAERKSTEIIPDKGAIFLGPA